MKDGKYVILCIDDDPDILATLKSVLESNGYLMEGAYSADEGVRRYKAVSPDFILVDLMMESIDAGKRFARELMALGNKAPVFMLSAVGDTLVTNVDYTELGLSGVFQKPVNAKTLVTTLKTKLR